jgi:hypothetical protein
MDKKIFLTVIETSHYWNKARKLLTESQREDVVTTVACEPEIGDLIQGTGGIRKFRYAFQSGKGKSGGARIVHLPLRASGKVYLLDIFAKSEKGNLSKAERNEMAKLVKILKGDQP